MKIYLLEGESFIVPGHMRSAHATMESLNAEAASWVNILREEVDLDNDATPEDWQAKCLEARQTRADESGCNLDDLDEGDVWFTEMDLSGVIAPVGGYEGAFYEIANLLNILAQPRSPKEVWEGQMLPRLVALINPPPHVTGQMEIAPHVTAADLGVNSEPAVDEIGPYEQALRDAVEPFLDWLEMREAGAHIQEVRDGLIGVEDVLPDDLVVLGAHLRADKDQGVLTMGHFRRLQNAYDGNAAPSPQPKTMQISAVDDPDRPWEPWSMMPAGDHRNIIREVLSEDGKTALAYFTGNLMALAPISENPEPLPFKVWRQRRTPSSEFSLAPVVHRALNQDADTIRYQLSEVLGTVDEYRQMPCKSLETRMFQAAAHAQRVTDEMGKGANPASEPIRCYVAEMKTSAGMDYFVTVRCGDREITPYMHKIRSRAEYGVAEWNWLFNGGEKPDILAYREEGDGDNG